MAKHQPLSKYGKAFYNLFKTESGRLVLEKLKEELIDAPIEVSGDPYLTHYKLGRHDYIRELIKYSQDFFEEHNIEIKDLEFKLNPAKEDNLYE